MRIPLIAGNWKMNNNIDESIKLVENLIELLEHININAEVIVCSPFTALNSIKQLIKGSNVKLGAQNMHYEDSGAYTGEISPSMLKDIGVDYVIIGHSERRQFFNETDEVVNKKLKAAIKYSIRPILCVGESLEHRESGIEKLTVKKQIINALVDINHGDAENIVIAYEPIWAIGTGRTATSLQANEMASFIRSVISELYSKELSLNMIIQYGGSVKGDNASEIMNQSDIDGALVGGASLKAEEFIKIINYNQLPISGLGVIYE